MQKGWCIRTIQHPHQGKDFHIDTILWPKSVDPILACHDANGVHVNLLPGKCYKPTGNYKVDLLQQIKLGCKNALKQYIKVYKQMPTKF